MNLSEVKRLIKINSYDEGFIDGLKEALSLIENDNNNKDLIL